MKESDRIYNYARNSVNKFTFEKIINPLHKALASEIEDKYKAKAEQLIKFYIAKITSKVNENKVSFSDEKQYVAHDNITKAIKEAFDEIKIEMSNF
jgi:hypothetical protein